MTTSLLNPFPDYAVTRLADTEARDTTTVVTGPIRKARHLVEAYIEGIAAPVTAIRTNAALCVVRGDYGTGKTHLLNDVAKQVSLRCVKSVSPSIVRATCIETDSLSWFRTKIGPQLDMLPLYDVALELYGNAGRRVAEATPLTESAAEVLRENPARIRDLIRTNHLSVDEVGREFDRQLGDICRGYDQSVVRVLARLVSSETDGLAREWISGATLTPRKAELLGVSESIDSPDRAASVIGAIAALHKAVGRPLLVLVDELEHLVRYDVAHKSWGNVTWLKRLLEHLGNAGALALVAGHWSAWHTTNDYLDRFPQHAPIDLVKLETSDVLKILRDRVSRPAAKLGEAQARVIATVTGGNMRRVMSLCNLLFRQSDGFAAELSEQQIRDTWTSVSQRISQEQALELITDLLTPSGFDVRTAEASFYSIPFDLVAEHRDGRAVLVQAKHSVTQPDHYDSARKFIDKLSRVATLAPRALGMFLANGSIDDELLSVLRGSSVPNLRWFDLTDRDVVDQIRVAMGAIAIESRVAGRTLVVEADAADAPLHGAIPTPSAAPVVTPSTTQPLLSSQAESEKLKAVNADLERRLLELEQKRHRETVDLNARLYEDPERERDLRDQSLRAEGAVTTARAHASYQSMVTDPSFDRKLRYLGQTPLLGALSVAMAIVAILGKDYLPLRRPLDMLVVLVSSVGWLLVGMWAIWRGYSQVQDYLEFWHRVIRDLYVRDVPIEELARADRVLRRTIERHGPRVAQKRAVDEMMAEMSKSGSSRALHEYLIEMAHST